MNERIKELAREAGLLVHNPDGIPTKLEKFAELVVRECIDWCNAHARDDGTAQRIAEDIKKDFGVKECDALHKEIDPANAYQKGWDDAMFRNSLGKNK